MLLESPGDYYRAEAYHGQLPKRSGLGSHWAKDSSKSRSESVESIIYYPGIASTVVLDDK